MKTLLITCLFLSSFAGHAATYRSEDFKGEICAKNFIMSDQPEVTLTCFREGPFNFYLGGKTYALKSSLTKSSSKNCFDFHVPAQKIRVGKRVDCELSISMQGATANQEGKLVSTKTRDYSQETITGFVLWNGVSVNAGIDLNKTLEFMFRQHLGENAMQCSSHFNKAFNEELISCSMME